MLAIDTRSGSELWRVVVADRQWNKFPSGSSSLAVSPDGAHLYVYSCGACNGMIREADGGEHWLQVFRSWYGPLLKAYAALEPAAQAALTDDLLALVGRFNRAGDGTMVVPSEYLEIVVTRR